MGQVDSIIAAAVVFPDVDFHENQRRVVYFPSFVEQCGASDRVLPGADFLPAPDTPIEMAPLKGRK